MTMSIVSVRHVPSSAASIVRRATCQVEQDWRAEAQAVGVRAFLTLLLVAMWASHSTAQEMTDSFEELEELIEIGNVVFVEDDSGGRFKGRLQELSGASLTIQTDETIAQQRQFSSSQVTQITRVDSRLSGFLIGLGVGAVPGALLGSTINSLCENESTADNSCGVGAAVVGAIVAAGGGWVGWAIDGAVDGETPIFVRSGSSRRLRLTPIVSPSSISVAFSFEF